MNDRFLTRPEIENLTGLSTSSIYRLMRCGKFPVPVKIGLRAVRWRETEITSYLSTRPRAEGESIG